MTLGQSLVCGQTTWAISRFSAASLPQTQQKTLAFAHKVVWTVLMRPLLSMRILLLNLLCSVSIKNYQTTRETFLFSVMILQLPDDHDLLRTLERQLSTTSQTPQPPRWSICCYTWWPNSTYQRDIIHWKQFWEQFTVAVHNLSNAEKMVYLQHAIKMPLKDCLTIMRKPLIVDMIDSISSNAWVERLCCFIN